MEFVPSLAMAALILKLVDFARYARNRDLNGVFTQAVVWAAGIAVVGMVAQTAWANGFVFSGVPLSKLGFWSQVFVGLSLASTTSLIKDTLKSVDNQNSSKIPTLLPPGPAVKRRHKAPLDTVEAG